MTAGQTITVAIPLHRSARWVDNVVDNVRRLPAAVTEIIVSDRTSLDDAAARIGDELSDDPRVTVRSEALGIGWAEHFQLLLDEACGELFMWMPHDDIFESSWIPVLVEALEREPTAWLAYGRLRPVAAHATTSGPRPPHHPRPGLISRARVAHLGVRGAGIGVRGLFRRQAVLDAGIRFDRPPIAANDPAADLAWVLAVGLRSALVYDDRTTTWKRYHESGTHTTWRRAPFADVRATHAVAREHLPTGLAGLGLRCLVWTGTARWALRRPVGIVINPVRDRLHRRRALVSAPPRSTS